MKQIRIGLVGVGTVGSGLLQLLEKNREIIKKRNNLDVQLVAIATRTPERAKAYTSLPVSSDVISITTRPDVDIVVELIGGTTTAFDVVHSALTHGKTVITANKALLSEKGDELFSQAWKNGVELGFEAAVAGSIPIIRTLRDGLSSCEFEVLCGILNGTTNFILTKMEEENWDYSVALKKAQDLGFAEADPTFDVEGIDAGHKISLLSSLAFREKVPFGDLQVEGISKLKSIDILSSKSLGYRIKLLGISKKTSGGILTKVHPTLVPLNHPLANVMNEFNAVYYKTVESGAGMVTGKGAGALPTASAVLADLIFYASKFGVKDSIIENNIFPKSKKAEEKENAARYYLRFSTLDKPGVLAEIAKVLGKNNISIASVQQKEVDKEPVHVIVLTHSATEGDFKKSIQEIDEMSSIIKEKTVAIRLLENL
ncbi:homoserine dehydrogenase [Leptospira kobayashii]|uniref:Homoserine dehydrogenase n=1 Tax=Leptospira kobayashii TaxID=1917830 RepID=A0ABN6K8K3_9LEPT|nr:homoserine dehydrogenase [Leptospira kobayashii]BDA77126.1 homoserine dehydrogenase [Leptospira kobayashii]